MKLVCHNCGTRYEEGKFCPECGSLLSEIAFKKVLVCPSCQIEAPSGKFCPECGTKLEEKEIEVDAETKDIAPAVEKSAPTIEPTIDSEVEAILTKYRDQYGDMRDLNKEEYAIAAEELDFCAKRGSLDGMCFLSLLYLRGLGVQKDINTAYNLVCEAEKKGSKYASAILGLCFAHGIIVDVDYKEAIRRLVDGYNQTHIPGIAGLAALVYGEIEDYSNAFKFAQIAADKEDKEGLTVLGALYLNGWGVNKDEKKAFECYLQAAAQGHEVALNQIGWMYQTGCGVEEDPVQAFFWYNESAQKGNDVGMNNLAYCYKDGYGVEQDVEAAAEWFKKAAETGCDNSMLELGKYYQETLFDLEKAKMWLLKAIDLGNTDAMNMLGNVFANSNYPCYDTRKAFEWYEKAANANCLDGMWNLACAYSNGTGCELDMEKAEEWLKKAADARQTEAMALIEERQSKIQKDNPTETIDKTRVIENLSVDTDGEKTITIHCTFCSDNYPHGIAGTIEIKGKKLLTKYFGAGSMNNSTNISIKDYELSLGHLATTPLKITCKVYERTDTFSRGDLLEQCQMTVKVYYEFHFMHKNVIKIIS